MPFLFRKSSKQKEALPDKAKKAVHILCEDIRSSGPVRGNWPNYSKLGKNRHHCHLKRGGKPTYVCVWEVTNKEIRIIEVSYVGTRENAPY